MSPWTLLPTAVHGYKSERAAVPKNLFVNPDAVWNNATKYFKTGAPAIVGYVPVYPVPSYTCDGVGEKGGGWICGWELPAQCTCFAALPPFTALHLVHRAVARLWCKCGSHAARLSPLSAGPSTRGHVPVHTQTHITNTNTDVPSPCKRIAAAVCLLPCVVVVVVAVCSLLPFVRWWWCAGP